MSVARCFQRNFAVANGNQLLVRKPIFLANSKLFATKPESDVTVTAGASEIPQYAESEVVEAEVRQPRNRSRLRPTEYKLEKGEMPPLDRDSSDYRSLAHRRKMFALYGKSSGLDPGLIWPSKEELSESMEYEAFAYPNSLQEMMQIEKMKKEAARQKVEDQKKSVLENIKKLGPMMEAFEKKKQQKVNEILAAQRKREKQIEEIRSLLGYKVDPRDEKFQTLLEQKQKEEQKAEKQKKQKERQEKLLSSLGAAPEGS